MASAHRVANGRQATAARLMNAAQRQLAARPIVHQWGRWLPLTAHVATGVLIALALVLAARRMAIGQMTPVALPTTLATAAVLLILAIALRRAAAGQLFFWMPTLLLAIWALACSYPGTQVAAWMVWGGALAIDLAAARHRRAALSNHPSQRHDASKAVTTMASNPLNAEREATLGSAPESAADIHIGEDIGEDIAEDTDGEVVLQHVVRLRDRDGREYIHATLRGEVAAGHRRTTLYVGFCPPFAVLPQVDAEVIEGPPGMAKVIQALHHGVQVEVDLDEASLDPVVVTVEVAAYPAEASGVSDRG
jgi:hypothetical protein